MGAVFKKEFKAMFTQPIGCVVLAVLFAYSGFNFFMYNLVSGSMTLVNVFSGLFTVSLLAIPFLTMRLFSDEKRQRTDQALLTAPVSLTGIVLGKFFAALAMYAIGIGITLVYMLVIAANASSSPDWLVYAGNYFGIILVGGLMISIGLLVSSLTESQVIAAVGTLAISLIIMMLDNLQYLFYAHEWLVKTVQFLSVSTRYNSFTLGVINYDDVIFFLSMQALFLFLTVRVLDRKRWN